MGSKADGIVINGNENISLSITLDTDGFSLDAVIDRILELILERCGNNKTLAAEFLKVDRKMFYRRGSKKMMKKVVGLEIMQSAFTRKQKMTPTPGIARRLNCTFIDFVAPAFIAGNGLECLFFTPPSQ
ncbi:MAG: sigma-54-dependent Fis family transcriptional regulator [Candidatus Brocadiaceae bacterium]|nr:sigma-54-dependent Fis family transcriptional regulator [Candidatus Brocadiaceae bacterium]